MIVLSISPGPITTNAAAPISQESVQQQPPTFAAEARAEDEAAVPSSTAPSKPTPTQPSTVDLSKLAQSARHINDISAKTLAEQEQAWREYFKSIRSRGRLAKFVGELTSLEMKLHQGLALIDRKTSDEARVVSLFHQHVVDERQLVAEMQSMVASYEQFQRDATAQMLQAAGVDASAGLRVGSIQPNTNLWQQAMAPVLATAVGEARRDVARFAANWVAADLAGDGIKQAARGLGLNNAEPGSFEDMITGAILDGAASIVIDELTDPTDEIVSTLAKKMSAAESALLDGPDGFLTQMHNVHAAHAAAREHIIQSLSQRKE
jgi:hypothetical protein